MPLNRAVLFFTLLMSSYGLLEGDECEASSTSSCDVDQHGKTMLQAGRDFKKHDALKIGQEGSWDFPFAVTPNCGGWPHRSDKYSPGYAAGVSTVFTGEAALKMAFSECVKLEDACKAITCAKVYDSRNRWVGSNCTLRASSQTKTSPPRKEYTKLKDPLCEPIGCIWAEQKSYYSGGYAGGVSKKFSYEDARLQCVQLGNETCKAITCSRQGKDCTVRASATLGGSSSGEITFMPTSACFIPTTTTTTTEAPQELHLAPKGAEECDYGEPVIEVNCEAAVQTLATKYGKAPARKMMVAAKRTFSCNSAWGGVPIGCSAQTGGDWTAHFKASSGGSSGPSGCVKAEYRLVCVSQR